MKKVTIITGKQGSGKTTKAIELVNGRSFLEIPNIQSVKNMKEIFLYEVLIFHDVDFSDKKNIGTIKWLITKEKGMIRKPYSKEMTEELMPDLIFMTNSSLIEYVRSVSRGHEIIEL